MPNCTSELAPLAEDSTSSSAPSSASGERPGEHWSVPAFFALGVGSLWAWNAFITPTGFYALLFEGTRWEDTFLPTLTSSFTLVGLVSILALQPLLHLVTARRRVLVSLGAIGVAFGGACLLALWPLIHGSGSAPSPAASAALLLSSAAGASVSQAVLTASLAGYATAFAPQQMSALSSGQAAAGVVVSLINLAREAAAARRRCAGSAGETEDDGGAGGRGALVGAALYFGASCAVAACCAAAFVALDARHRPRGPEGGAKGGSGGGGGEGEGGSGPVVALLRLARALLGWEAALFLCFGVTLFVFPTLTSAIRASEAAPSSCEWRRR